MGIGHLASAVLDRVPYLQSDPFILLIDDKLNLPGGTPVGETIAANKRHLYVLSLRTGNFRECTEEYLKERIKENIPTLLDQYQNDVMANKKDFESVAYKYINLLTENLVSKAQD